MGSKTLWLFHNGMLIEQNWSAKVADQIKSGNAQNDEDECKLGWTAFHTSWQGDLVTSEVHETIDSMLPDPCYGASFPYRSIAVPLHVYCKKLYRIH